MACPMAMGAAESRGFCQLHDPNGGKWFRFLPFPVVAVGEDFVDDLLFRDCMHGEVGFCVIV